MNYWLLKSEPKTYSIEMLQSEGQTIWDGVRNYQARNFLKEMQPDDLAFFYHSNVPCPGIVGLTTIIANNIVDPTQFDAGSPYYDPKANSQSPRWYTVIVAFRELFPQLVSLKTLKQEFSEEELYLNRRGNRLSVMPISHEVATKIFNLRGLG